ncbi:MAG: hypothetical protein MUP47_02645 [Phycisphaerae bacterium]|nr:hypothetical protein [Phycisphaerae bacterium]
MRLPKPLLLLVVVMAFLGCAPQIPKRPGTAMTTEVRRAPWQTGPTAGSELTTAHYRIFTTATNRALVTYMPGFLEAAYRNDLDLTGLADRPDAPLMPVYLMGTRGEWASLTMSVVGQQAAGPYLAIQAGGYCHQGVCVFWDIGVVGTFSVASHEGLHQFFYHRLRDRLPMWLEEGLCTVAEGYEVLGDLVTFTAERNNFRFTDLRTAIVQGRFLRLQELLTTDSGEAVGGSHEQAVGYYGQLWALAQFIRSEPATRAGMQRLLADAEAGRLHEALKTSADDLAALRRHGRAYNKTVSLPLFRQYIAPDLAAFENDYKQFATRLARLQ